MFMALWNSLLRNVLWTSKTEELWNNPSYWLCLKQKNKKTGETITLTHCWSFVAFFHLLTPQFSLEQQKLPSSVVVNLSCSLRTSYTVCLAILHYEWLFWVQVVLNVVTEPPTTSRCKLRLVRLQAAQNCQVVISVSWWSGSWDLLEWALLHSWDRCTGLAPRVRAEVGTPELGLSLCSCCPHTVIKSFLIRTLDTFDKYHTYPPFLPSPLKWFIHSFNQNTW